MIKQGVSGVRARCETAQTMHSKHARNAWHGGAYLREVSELQSPVGLAPARATPQVERQKI